jgi:hypothetical protein
MTVQRWTIVVALGALVGCLPEPSFPNEPSLSFVSFDLRENGSRELVLAFTDGDGDIGLDQGDTLPPFCASCAFHQNLKCEYDELQNGVWTWVELNPEAGQIPFYYRVPRVEPTGQNPALNGTISVDMNSWFLQSEYDSLRFRVTLFDRALTPSNEVVTDVVVKP